MHALGAIQALEAIELVGNLNPPRPRKKYLQRYDPFSLRDDEFKRRYRFNKKTASFIIELVEKDLFLEPRGCGTSPALQVLTAIRCWGRREVSIPTQFTYVGRFEILIALGSSLVQDDGGYIHGLSQPTVSRICARVARALARHSETFIKMPQTLAEQQCVMRKYAEIGGFPTVLGSINCTHLRIKKYGKEAQYFINRKGNYSINVQVVCDAKLLIRDIEARWRGSTHDSHIFNESTLKERFKRGEFSGCLLGDSGYAMEKFLFTPILRPQNLKEEEYNKAQIATQNCVERCFGVWKQRFQTLLTGIPNRMHNIEPTIIALAVLHNIAINHNDPVPALDNPEDAALMDDDFPLPVGAGVGGRAGNNAYLSAFIEKHF